jgi:hypothetical protein
MQVFKAEDVKQGKVDIPSRGGSGTAAKIRKDIKEKYLLKKGDCCLFWDLVKEYTPIYDPKNKDQRKMSSRLTGALTEAQGFRCYKDEKTNRKIVERIVA